MMLAACPCCDLERAKLTPLQAMAFGMGVRHVLDDDEPIASQMCPEHRLHFSRAMMHVAIAISRIKGLS